MTSSSDRPQQQYAVYQVYKEIGSRLIYNLSAGPFTDRKEAIHKAEELNQSEPEVYYAYVVSEYQGESWSPDRPSSFGWEIENRD